MAFIKIEGFTGNIYVPEINPGKKKNPCRDCYSCQYCSDERCELCLRNKVRGKKNSDLTHDGKDGEELKK